METTEKYILILIQNNSEFLLILLFCFICGIFAFFSMYKELKTMLKPVKAKMTEREKEPVITINGNLVTDAQAMTIRCAIDSFDSSLAQDGLGDDSHGVSMVKNYRRNITDLRNLIFSKD